MALKLKITILDATWLLNEAGVGSLVSYPYFKKATATDLIKKYYSGLSRETLMKARLAFSESSQ